MLHLKLQRLTRVLSKVLGKADYIFIGSKDEKNGRTVSMTFKHSDALDDAVLKIMNQVPDVKRFLLTMVSRWLETHPEDRKPFIITLYDRVNKDVS